MITSSQKKNNYYKNFFRAKRAGGVKKTRVTQSAKAILNTI